MYILCETKNSITIRLQGVTLDQKVQWYPSYRFATLFQLTADIKTDSISRSLSHKSVVGIQSYIQFKLKKIQACIFTVQSNFSNRNQYLHFEIGLNLHFLLVGKELKDKIIQSCHLNELYTVQQKHNRNPFRRQRTHRKFIINREGQTWNNIICPSYGTDFCSLVSSMILWRLKSLGRTRFLY